MQDGETRNHPGACRRASGALLFAVLLGASACIDEPSPPPAPAADGGGREAALQVFAGNYPLRYFAERIGGERVEVFFPIPAGRDPSLWRPTAEDVQAIQGCDLILLNGATYERWVSRATLPEARVVDTSSGFASELIQVEDAVTHSHGPEGKHSHAGTASITWLDLALAARQAQAVAAALVELHPAETAALEAAARALAADLGALGDDIAAIVARDPPRPLLGSHPLYHYLTRRYELNLESLHWEPDEFPPEEEWQALATLRETHPARWILWEAEPQARTAERLAGLGVTSVVFDPCGNAPAEGDFLSRMRANVEALREVFSPSP
jgi:zinc transport system substrate-binding protein